jgi:hypothetical protein
VRLSELSRVQVLITLLFVIVCVCVCVNERGSLLRKGLVVRGFESSLTTKVTFSSRRQKASAELRLPCFLRCFSDLHEPLTFAFNWNPSHMAFTSLLADIPVFLSTRGHTTHSTTACNRNHTRHCAIATTRHIECITTQARLSGFPYITNYKNVPTWMIEHHPYSAVGPHTSSVTLSRFPTSRPL